MTSTLGDFGENDPEVNQQWSEKIIRKADKEMFFAPWLYNLTDPKGNRSPDAPKGQGIIQQHTTFAKKDKKGKTVTIHAIGDLEGEGVEGDQLMIDTSGDIDSDTMTLTFSDIAHSARTKGPMQERLTVYNIREIFKEKLARYARRKTEGAIVLPLWGLTSWVNSGVLKNWPNTSQATVFGNTIQAYPSSHIVYAGGVSARADLNDSCLLTAEFLMRLETKAFEDLADPLECLDNDGEEELILFTGMRGVEQLLADEVFQRAQRNNVQGSSNPMIRRSVGKLGRIRVVPYPRALNPAANVGRSILCGRDALQFCKVDDWSYYEDFADLRKRRKIGSIGAALGAALTVFNSVPHGSIAVEHHVRT